MHQSEAAKPQTRVPLDGTQLDEAIERGLALLTARQMDSGQFDTRIGRGLSPDAPGISDSSPFVTTIVVSSLACSDHPAARSMVERGTEFLRSTMDELGACRYWCVDHPGRDHMPPDVDTTSCVSEVLRVRGIPFPDNRRLLAANRNGHGLFYTWFAPRRWGLRASRAHRQLLADQRANPQRSRDFWRSNELSPYSVDSVVNVHVLGYLGEVHATRRIVPYLFDVVQRNAEASSDQWYQSLVAFYWAISRFAADGMASLRPFAAFAADRLGRLAKDDGSVGQNPLETALATCALINFDVAPDIVHRASHSLLATQLPSGAWPIAPIYFGGKDDDTGFGSEELTTALALQVLIRCGARDRASQSA